MYLMLFLLTERGVHWSTEDQSGLYVAHGVK